MTGKHSVFLCHVEKIYMRILGEMRYVPVLSRGKAESITVPPPTLSYLAPLSRTEETVQQEAGRTNYC